MTFSRNELNQNSKGGTELTTTALQRILENSANVSDKLDKFQIITSRVRELDENRIRVLHLHDLANDPESQHLKDPNKRNRFHKLVFSSNWQYQQFRDYLGVPFDSQSTVIETGVDSFRSLNTEKDRTGTVRLIYFSTPHRGLQILVPVFEELAKNNPNVILDVFSSFKIYGWDQRDAEFEELYERCRQHTQINYHGFQEQEVVREAVSKAHILAYPNIWPETSCRTLIEAMMAGVLCVHPNFGALPDTAGGMTFQYDYVQDINQHANIFYQALSQAVGIVQQENIQNHLKFISNYADARFSWDNIGPRWEQLIFGLYEQYKDADLSFPKPTFSFRTA